MVMRSIMVTYPEFQSLPKGIKRMLLESERHFFDELKPALSPRLWIAAEEPLPVYRFPLPRVCPAPMVTAFST